MTKSVPDTKRVKLLEMAAQMLEREGFQQFKVAELAKAGSVSISTVYAMFGSKEGIYLAYIEAKIAMLFEGIDRLNADDPVLQLQHYASMIFEMVQQGRLVLEEGVRNNPLFFSALGNEFPQSAQKLYAFLASCFSKINPNLDQRAAQLCAYAFNGQLHGYLQFWVVAGGDPQALAEQLCDTFICQTRGSYTDAQHKTADKKRGIR
ncbi:TetR/AcrR family transcriptional regulator [Sulfurimonas sp. HSL-3221]|uniref:TetR/AcrR family transcriptional regulator n=1 Tax=Sulfurimonadaceae TaxID=2771471 RepID=UPI001E4F862E|nr:TetR/AcrR family transcriptional regulator [Sulfurimonas sp. HSL-3221]UFS61841.1 TetR/AcrR family transcriptional regulator [Sulfurimonas sp. HSL-3221]